MLARLTGRQRQILQLVMCGASHQEVARQLGIRPTTVRVHLYHARQKAQSRSTVDLAVRAARARPA